jgi:hypothetical protein
MAPKTKPMMSSPRPKAKPKRGSMVEGKMAEGTGARFMTNIEAPLKSKRPKKNPKTK